MNKITFQFADESQTSGIASVNNQDGTLLAIYSFICKPNQTNVAFETGTNQFLDDVHSSIITFNNVRQGFVWF